MRDNLDLKQLAKQARQQKLWGRTFSFLGILILIVLVTSVLLYSDNSSETYQLIDEKLVPINDLAGTPVDVQIASNGKLWVQTQFPSALYEKDTNTSWIEHQNFGTDKAVCICSFAISDTDVWLATDKGAATYDGKEWIFFPEATIARPVSIAASKLGTFIVDQAGNLSHYVNGEWNISDIESELPPIAKSASNYYVSLDSEVNGNILLQWKGIWRFDGDQWSELVINNYRLDTNDLIGTTGNTVWIRWGSGLTASNDTGSIWEFHEFEQMGLPEETRFYGVNTFNDVTTFATDQGLLHFDGDNWELAPIPNVSTTKFEHVYLLPDNQVWVVTGNASLSLVTVIIACASTLLFFLFLVIAAVLQFKWRNRLTSTKSIIDALLPDAPQINQRKQNPWPLVALMVLLIAVVVWPFIFQTMSPTIIYILMVVLFIYWFTRSMTASTRTSSRKQFSLYNLRVAFTAFGLIILWAAGFIIIGGWITKINSTLTIVFAIFWIIAPIIWMRRYSRSKFQLPLQKGEYAHVKAYLQAEIQKLPEGSSPFWTYKGFYAEAVLLAGDVREAEEIIKQSLINMRNAATYLQSIKLAQISSAISYQERYEEALKFAEAAIQLSPTSHQAWTNLVNLYLYYGLETDRSLEIAEFGQKYGVTTWYAVLGNGSTKLYDLATYAWALARAGRVKEADTIIEKLSQKLNNHHKSSIAFFYYIQGRIEEAKGNQAQAAEWFTKASQSDSGLYGQLAAKALSALSSGTAPATASK